MNKHCFSSVWSILSVIVLFSMVLFSSWALAASTIGTNMSTTGTFTVTPATDSATSVRFQNSAGTNYFIGNSTLGWVGIGAAPQTTFEVQGTASASYLLTGNTIQVGGFASVAYNRFGTAAATASELSTTNDVLINGNLEVDLRSFFDAPAEFQGTASASYLLTGNTIQVGGFASVAYNRFGTNTTTQGHYITGSSDFLISGDLEVDGSGSFSGPASFSNSIWVGTMGKTGNVGVGTSSPLTKFHVVGSASVSNNFETLKTASANSLFASTNLVVGSGGTASSSTVYSAEFGTNTTATVSVLFGGSTASSKGTCFQFKDAGGTWVYARVLAGGTSFTINNIKCHQ